MSDLYEPRGLLPRLRWWIIAGVTALVVVALVVVAVLGRDDDAEAGAPPLASDSICGLEPGDKAVPTSAPTSEWELVGGVAVPLSKKYGPGRVNEGIPSCFAHSPTGAVFAAASYLGPPNDPTVKVRDLVEARFLMDDAGRAVAAEAEGHGEPSDTPAQLVGFRVLDATDERVTLDLAVRVTQGPKAGALAALTFTMVWSEGDWRIRVDPSQMIPTSTISSLNGFTQWSGAV